MGCCESNNTEINGELFNEDVDIKRFLTGIHFSKGAEGLESNVQIALGTTRKKEYERVSANVNSQAPSSEEN